MDSQELDALEKATRDDATMLQPLAAEIIALSASRRKEVRWHVAQLLPRLQLDGQSDRTRRIAILSSWLDGDESTFVRVSALQSLVELARREPALLPYVRTRVAVGLDDRSAAVRARARKLSRLL